MKKQDWANKKAKKIINKLQSIINFYTLRDYDELLIREISKALREERKIHWPTLKEISQSFKQKHLEFPHQDNEYYYPDRAGFKSGWFSCFYWVKKRVEEKYK